MTRAAILVGIEGPPHRIGDLLPTALGALGYSPGPGLQLTIHPAPRGLWAQLGVSRAFGHGLAARAAAGLGRPVRLITVVQPNASALQLELEATPQHSTFAPPSSLGDPKLDALAARIRLAVHAEITSLEGARGVKLRTLDGGTDFDVVGPEALAKLQGVFPQL